MEMNYTPAQKRVIFEKAELDEKISRIQTLINCSIFRRESVEEQLRVRKQLKLMLELSNIYKERIDNFKKT